MAASDLDSGSVDRTHVESDATVPLQSVYIATTAPMPPLHRKPTLPVASTPAPPRLPQTRFVAGARSVVSFGATTTGHGVEEVEELQVDGGAQEAAEAGHGVRLPVLRPPRRRRVPHRPEAQVRQGVVPHPKYHRYAIRRYGYGYGDTVIRRFSKKIRIRRYGKYIYF